MNPKKDRARSAHATFRGRNPGLAEWFRTSEVRHRWLDRDLLIAGYRTNKGDRADATLLSAKVLSFVAPLPYGAGPSGVCIDVADEHADERRCCDRPGAVETVELLRAGFR